MKNDLVAAEKADEVASGTDDKRGPRNLMNLVPPGFAKLIGQVPHDLLKKTPEELEILKGWQRFTARENQIRIAFWNEYERASNSGTRMMLSHVYSGIMTRPSFYELAADPVRLAFVIQPPDNYAFAMQEALMLSVRRVREILEMPLYDKKGVPNVKVAEFILEAHKQLDLRINGSVIQRVEQKSLNVNVKKDERNVISGTQSQTASIENIDEELKALEARTGGMAAGAPGPKEVVIQSITLNVSESGEIKRETENE